ncbi:MAG: hypothetical protein MZW92_78150 [Comamonadaceae bacterium]|nr:hypothetical protein [Comamonadaceae bacterium]
MVLYWALFVHGVEELRPMLGAPAAGTLARGRRHRRRRTGAQRRRRAGRDLAGPALADMLQHGAGERDRRARSDRRARRDQRAALDLSGSTRQDLEGDFLQQLGLRLVPSERAADRRPGVARQRRRRRPGSQSGRPHRRDRRQAGRRAGANWLRRVRDAPGACRCDSSVERGGAAPCAIRRAERASRARQAHRAHRRRRARRRPRCGSALLTTVRYGPLDALRQGDAPRPGIPQCSA